jgi:hypothetical protein
MSDVWTKTTKARAPDAERAQMTPTGDVLPAHDDERAGYEAQLYALLIDGGWTCANQSDCTLHDVWFHETSPHSGRPGHELVSLLGFDPERAFVLLQRAGEPKPKPNISPIVMRLLRRARGEE